MANPWDNDPIIGQQPSTRGGVMTVGEPRGPKPQAKTVQDGFVIDPNTASATPIAGLPSKGQTAPSGYRFNAQGNLEAIPGGPADKKTGGDGKPTEFQSKSAGFLGRLMRANSAWETLPDDAKGPRNLIRQGIHDSLPGIENTFLNSPDRQTADQNVEDFIAASLRQESGAAINKDEFDRQYKIFFPQPGDSKEVIAQKALARKQAIQGFKIAAGPLAEETLANLQLGDGKKEDPNNPNNATLYQSGDIGFNTPAGPDNPLTPEQQAAYDAWNKANPNATPEQLAAFGQSIGVTINNAQDIINARDKGAGVAPGSTAINKLTPQERQEVDQRVGDTGGFMRTAAGVADTATLGTSNKIIAALRDIAGKGEYDRELLKANAITDQIGNEDPLLYHGGQFFGGLALPGFGAKTIPQLARLGAGYGGAYGIGSSDNLADVPENLITNAGIGGGAGALGGLAGNALGRLGANRAAGEGRQVYDAAERIGMVDPKGRVQVMPADVGGPTTRRLTAAGAQGPVSALPIVKAAQGVTDAAQAARGRIAGEVGNPAELEAAGQAASRGSERFIKRTSQRGGDLYKRAEAAAGDAKVPLPKALEAIDRNVAELGQSPVGSDGLSLMQELRQALQGEFSVKGIRQMRTQLRDKFLKDGLRGSDLERRVEEVVSAAAEDISDGLASQGNRNAAGLYKLADRYWRARLDTIDNVLGPIIGKRGEKSGEEVMRSINQAAVGNNARLAGLLKALPVEDQGTVRATIIDNLGRASNGAQNAEGKAFSLASFLTHWNALSPGAKRTLFAGETRAALDDLAKVADGSKQAQRYANHSNTAGGIMGQIALSGGIGATGGFMPLIAATISQYGAGRLLASPRFARWLVGASKSSNPAAHVSKLGSIAAREGAIAGEVTGLQQALMRAVNDNGLSQAAASDPNESAQ